MSHFNRVKIVQVRDGVRRWLEQEEDPRIAVTLALYADGFDTCLAEIDRLTRSAGGWEHDALTYAKSRRCQETRAERAESNTFFIVPSSTFTNMSGLRDKLSLIAALAMVGCAACATLAWLNQDVWYLWVTLAGVALLVAIVTRDW